LVVPLVNGNGFRALITGIVCLVGGLYISTDLASVTTKVAHGIGQFTDTANLSSICDGANPLTWLIYRAGNLSIVALIIVGIIALALAVLNGMRIRKAAKADA
jgi:PTS system galactitol-specific IIC component